MIRFHNIRQRILAASVCAGCAVASAYVSFEFYYARRVSAQAPSTASNNSFTSVRPFSASISKDYYTQSGSLGKTETIDYVRFSDHSWLIRPREVYPDAHDLVSQFFDTTNEREVFLEPATKSVTTMAYPLAEQVKFLSGVWDETCPAPNTEDITTTPDTIVLFGHTLSHVVKRWDNDWTTERWMAPELECFSLREIDTVLGAHSERRVTSLYETEPPRTAIQVPADYVERSPLAVEDLYKNATGRVSLWGATLAKRLDDEYQRRNARR